jgi:beta-lactam-binding protein with PASTA domain
VPDVSGLTIAEATDALESVGLVRSGVAGGGDTVESSSPRAGELLRPGDSVELWAPL